MKSDLVSLKEEEKLLYQMNTAVSDAATQFHGAAANHFLERGEDEISQS